ncbi:Fc receptor-like protein 5 [Misgurnus anguillicaudatus]|uniref:Fc receptor-like protein 5 n=1 Tax=Misgurnus anguillicaudatus TaxID=75329 RepID=UPI003CCEFA6E
MVTSDFILTDITPTLTVKPQTSVFIGDTVTLTCEVPQSTGWQFFFTKSSNTEYYETTGTTTIRSVKVSDGGEYKCRAGRKENPQVYTKYSEPITVTVQDIKPTLTVEPQMPVFIGDSVTLTCEIHQSTGWEFIFRKHPNTESTETTGTKIIRSVQVSDGGEYTCQARKIENPYFDTQYSKPITVTVHDITPTLTVQPQTPVFIGDKVTLICEIDQSTGWEFFFINPSNTEFTETTGTKTIRSVRVSDGGEYKCRAGNIENPQVYTQYSKPIIVTVQRRLPEPTKQQTVQGRGTGMVQGRGAGVVQGRGAGVVQGRRAGVVQGRGTGVVQGRGAGVDLGRGAADDSGESGDSGETGNSGEPDVTGDSGEPGETDDSGEPGDSGGSGMKAILIAGAGVTRVLFKAGVVVVTALWITGAVCPEQEPNFSPPDCNLPSPPKRPTPEVSVLPADHVFKGETVNLRCVINGGGVSSWQYSWYKNDSIIQQDKLQYYTIRSVTESDAGKYTCRGNETSGARYSHISNAVTLTVSELKPKPELTSDTEGSVLTGNTVTLKCHIDQSTGWKFYWYKHTQNTEKTTTQTNSYTIHSVKVSDGGQYWCRAGRRKPDYYTDYSDGLWINVTESFNPVVSVYPDTQLFRGETVTLRCDIQDTGDTEWTYSWTVEKTNNRNIIPQCNTQECKINNIQYYHSGKYTCRGKMREQNTEMSDAVTLTVSSDKPQTVLSVSPQQWLTEGDSVTLMCEVINSSTGWTFSWFTVQSLYSGNISFISDSSGGSKGIYTVSSVTVKHTGVYMCRAERGDPVYHTDSNTQTLWITGVSPSVSLIIRPNRSQHFSSESLSLSCEDHSNSTGWTVRRYTDKLKPCSSSDWRSTGTTSTCTIRSLNISDTGVYWCQSESGEKLHPVNISVHNVDVILDSPVHPVTEGDLLTLHCLYRDKTPSNLRAEFYKDGLVVQSQTTGDMMIIPTVSKSHEGFYYCKHPERGESPKSWISVRDKPQTVLSVSPQQWLTEGDSVTLMCEVINSSTDWTFSLFTVQSSLVNKDDYELVSSSNGGSKGNYTVSSVTVKHTGVYMCRAERGDPVYHTEYSNTQTLWITDVSPSVSLIIRPNRSQHFSSESLSLSCEDHSNSTGWTVRRYTEDKLKPCSSSDWRSTGTTSTCTIRYLYTSDTGVYWCQSESGEKLHLVNISVHNFVILDSPVHPVTEGDPLTLRCLYQDKNPSNMKAEFYKDGLVVQNQTTGDMMIIPTVSKSHEGFYYCKYPERGESPKSWISVRASSLKKPPSFGLIVGLCLGLSVMFLVFFLVLLWCYKNKKLGCQSSSAVSQQQNISQTSDQKQTEDGYTPLQFGDAHIYNSADATDDKDTSTVTQAGPSDAMYSKVNFKKKKLKSKGRN